MIEIMIKFKVHKSCSCRECRSGKKKGLTQIVERGYRHDQKIKLKKLGEDFDNEVNGGDYFD